MENVKKVVNRSPISWVPTAYFAMGMPFVIVNMVAVLMYKDLGIDEETITFWTGLILLPWSLKFVWSPIMELYKTKKFYVVLTQLLSGVSFGLIALALNLPSFWAITIALFAVVAFSGATHDIALDGLYMQELDKDTQAKYIGWQGAFYNMAKLVATGGLVYLAGLLIKYMQEEHGMAQMEANFAAWMYIMGIFAALLIGLGVYHFFILPSGGAQVREERKTLQQTLKELWEVIMDFFRKKHIAYYIFFIVLYRFAEGFVVKMVPLFLKAPMNEGGLGLDNETIGLLYGSAGSLAFVLGSILAGYYISALGLKRTLFSLCCIFNLPFAIYTLLALYQPTSLWLIGGGIAVEYFGYGFGFVGLTLFMMQQIAPGKYQMSHYALASAIMNFGVMLPGMLSGWVWKTLGGYEPFFIFVLVATIPAFLITWFVPFTYADKKK